MKKFDYYQPETLKEAYRLMEKSKGGAKYIAGGTDLIANIKKAVIQPDALISLKRIKNLTGMSHKKFPALVRAVKALATPQIRNVATIGGNLCNSAPSADCAPPLLVMGAGLTLEGPGGNRKVPIEDFFKGPGQTCIEAPEILTTIRIPPSSEVTNMAFLKLGRVLRLRSVEKVIEDQEISPELLNRVGKIVEEEVNPITDVRSTEEYRRTMSGVLVKRAIEEAIKGTKENR